MKVKRIIFTPVIEDGKHLSRPLRYGEFFQDYEGTFRQINHRYTKPYTAQPYTRTEEEVEVKVPKYQWAIAPLEGTFWETTEFYENEKEMLLDAISIAESSWRWRRLDFTRIEE